MVIQTQGEQKGGLFKRLQLAPGTPSCFLRQPLSAALTARLLPAPGAGVTPRLPPRVQAVEEASSHLSPVCSFHNFRFGILISLVLVREMHPYLITGNPFCDLYFKAFFSLYFPLPFFFLFWQKYRPNMMCILLKVQHNLLPLVCLQSKQFQTA